jgi:hypothetical protein
MPGFGFERRVVLYGRFDSVEETVGLLFANAYITSYYEDDL